MITHSFFKAAHIKKNGKSKLYLRITTNREHRYYELMNIDSKQWVKSKGRLKANDEDSSMANSMLNKTAQEVDRVIMNIQSRKLDETFANFESLYYKKSEDLVSYFAEVISKMHEPEYNINTVRLYRNCLDKITNLTKGNPISISEVDYNFISRFESDMAAKGLKRNTISSQLKKLNKVLNDARKQGLIDRNPFETFQIRQEKTNREFLLKDELKKIHDLYNSGSLSPVLCNTLLPFLFACYTGLRHSDVVKIKYKDISKDNSIDITLKKKTSNGYKRLIVPLSQKAIKLINLDSQPDELIFPKLITATKCSHHLKAIAAVCNIDKNISFHTARHTFATISLGIGIELKKYQSF